MKKLLTAAFIVMLMACICIGGALFVQAQDETSGQQPPAHVHSWTYADNVATCSAEGCDVTTCGPDNHIASAEWLQKTDSENGMTYHCHTCMTCDIEMDKGYCANGTASCTELAVCDGCKKTYGELALHTPSADWTQDSTKTYHYHACTACGAELEEGKGTCSGGTATCKDLAVCTACNGEYGAYADHVRGELLQYPSLNYHYYFCSVCQQGVDSEYCYGGVATCNKLAICEGCGNTYGDFLHRKDTVLIQDKDHTYHYYACLDCDAEFEKANCSGGAAANCTDLPDCEVCGNPYGNVYGAHTEAPIILPCEDSAEYHIWVYPCCDDVANPIRGIEQKHIEGTAANCHGAAVCAICGLQYGQINPNHHDTSKVTIAPLNDTHHKVICQCGVELEPAAHRGGTATCSKQAICEDCATPYGSYNDMHSYDGDCDADCNGCGLTRVPAEHVFGEWEITKQPTETEAGEQKRVCTTCGEAQTATIAAITNPNGSGQPESNAIKTSTVVIIVAVVVVACVGVMAIALLVKKKEK